MSILKLIGRISGRNGVVTPMISVPASDFAADRPALPQGNADETIRLMQADVFADVNRVGSANLQLQQQLRSISETLSEVGGHAGRFKELSSLARENAATVSRQLGALVDESTAMDSHVRTSQTTIDKVEGQARSAVEGTQALRESLSEIGQIVETIAKIAAQTNLLALNATIEAARAGDAGRGFAVVASEVKSLSGQTQAATDRIAATIERVRTSAVSSMDEISAISQAIGDLRTAFTDVAVGIERQSISARDLAALDARNLDLANRIDTDAEELGNFARAAQSVALDAENAGHEIADTIIELHDHAAMLVSQTGSGEGIEDRLPVILPGTLEIGRKRLEVETGDLSHGAAFIRSDEIRADMIGERGTLIVTGLGRFNIRIAATRKGGADLAILGVSAATVAPLDLLLGRLKAHYAAYISRAQDFARAVGAEMDQALARQAIGEEQLFDSDYRPVPGTNPQQYTNAAVAFLETLLPPITEPELARMPRPNFAVAQDRNGYVPMHNKEASLPQRPGEVEWNMRHSRNRRIFRDRAGLAGSRNLRPSLVQYYHRDMGGGQFQTILEFNAPVYAAGRHWGCIRLSFPMERGLGHLPARQAA